MSVKSKLVYINPSFAEGMSRIVDIGGALKDEYIVVRHDKSGKIVQYTRRTEKQPLNPSEVDADALTSDWGKVTGDLKVVESKIKSKYVNHRLERQHQV